MCALRKNGFMKSENVLQASVISYPNNTFLWLLVFRFSVLQSRI